MRAHTSIATEIGFGRILLALRANSSLELYGLVVTILDLVDRVRRDCVVVTREHEGGKKLHSFLERRLFGVECVGCSILRKALRLVQHEWLICKHSVVIFFQASNVSGSESPRSAVFLRPPKCSGYNKKQWFGNNKSEGGPATTKL